MAANLNPRGPLLVGGLVVAALWLMNRQAATAARGQAVSAATKTQDYHTPTAVAKLLGNVLSIVNKGATPTAAVGASATPNMPAIDLASAFKGAFGWNTDDKAVTAGTLSSPLTGWYMPLPSLVRTASLAERFGAVDGSIDTPIYDVGEDFSNNPFAAFAL